MPHRNLVQRIKDRKYTVGIIGMGYVGLPLTRSFYEAGFDCVGFDVDEKKIKMRKKQEIKQRLQARDFQK